MPDKLICAFCGKTFEGRDAGRKMQQHIRARFHDIAYPQKKYARMVHHDDANYGVDPTFEQYEREVYGVEGDDDERIAK